MVEFPKTINEKEAKEAVNIFLAFHNEKPIEKFHFIKSPIEIVGKTKTTRANRQKIYEKLQFSRNDLFYSNESSLYSRIDEDLQSRVNDLNFKDYLESFWCLQKRRTYDFFLSIYQLYSFSSNKFSHNSFLNDIFSKIHMLHISDKREAFIVYPPKYIRLDARKRLHSIEAPAIEWEDGYGLHYLEDIFFRKDKFDNIPKMSAKKILSEKNSEIKRILIEMVGWEKFFKELPHQLIDEDKCPSGLPRKLVQIKIERNMMVDWQIRLLKMTNGTVEPDGKRREFVEQVPLTIKTCKEAVAWQLGLPTELYIEKVRT